MTKFFYISSRGATASTWLTTIFNSHPEILAVHGCRSMPPLNSGTGDMTPEKFFSYFPKYRDAVKPSATIMGGIHGYYGISSQAALNKLGGSLAGVVRHPINRIHSLFSHQTRGIHSIGMTNKHANVYEAIVENKLDMHFERQPPTTSRPADHLRTFLSKLKRQLRSNSPIPNLSFDYRLNNKLIQLSPIEQLFSGLCSTIFEDDLQLMHYLPKDSIFRMEALVADTSALVQLIDTISQGTASCDKAFTDNLSSQMSQKINQHSKRNFSTEEIYDIWPASFKFIYQTILKSIGGDTICQQYESTFGYNIIPPSDERFMLHDHRIHYETA